MSDPIRDFIAASRDAALSDRTPVTLAYAALADDVLTALDRERAEREPDCTGWQERYRTGTTTGRRLWCEDGCAEWRAGWRAGRDAAAVTLEQAERERRLTPDAATVATMIIRALPDPDPDSPTQTKENER